MRIKRSVRIVNGKNSLTEIDESKVKKTRRRTSQADIDKCLHCTKPASKCKGECE